MELNWSTFIWEIVNFLVLVWILKRFLYKPVLEVIARRRASVAKTLADAEALQSEAKAMQVQYEGRLAEWQEERRKAREALGRELDEERSKRMAALQADLEQEKENARVREERRQADATYRLEDAALVQGARFAARVLQQAAGPDMETRLVELAIRELSELPAENTAALRNRIGEGDKTIVVTSAFELAPDQRERLEKVLTKVLGAEVPVRYERDAELIAGLQMAIGAWVLGANLRDELKGFAELSHG